MIFATNNSGKLREVREILKGYDIKSLKEVNLEVDVLEDGDTFYDNAYKKAKYVYDLVGIPVIADDSGLCIDVLDGFPGVMTNRFLGDDVSDEERNLALIDKMKSYTDNDRRVRFICNIVYYDGANTLVGVGELVGKIADSPKGNGGFGFDSIFLLDSGKTLAELSMEEKNKCSARYLAIKDLKNKLDNLKL